jgi:hypothetical protein
MRKMYNLMLETVHCRREQELAHPESPDREAVCCRPGVCLKCPSPIAFAADLKRSSSVCLCVFCVCVDVCFV